MSCGYDDALLHGGIPAHDLEHGLEATASAAPAVGEHEEALSGQPAKVPAYSQAGLLNRARRGKDSLGSAPGELTGSR